MKFGHFNKTAFSTRLPEIFDQCVAVPAEQKMIVKSTNIEGSCHNILLDQWLWPKGSSHWSGHFDSCGIHWLLYLNVHVRGGGVFGGFLFPLSSISIIFADGEIFLWVFFVQSAGWMKKKTSAHLWPASVYLGKRGIWERLWIIRRG